MMATPKSSPQKHFEAGPPEWLETDESSKQSVGMKVDERGRIALPMFGTGFTAGEFCAELYGHMAKQGTAFLRGGQVCKIVHDPESGGKKIEIVDAASMATWIENFADVYTSNKNGDKLPTSVGEKSGRVIFEGRPALRSASVGKYRRNAGFG